MTIKERNRIVEQYENIAWWMINKNRRLIAALRLEDLDVYQELIIALIKAVDKYDPERGTLKGFIFMKLQYAILNLKQMHKPYGMTRLSGIQPQVQSLDYVPEDDFPLEIPCEGDFALVELMDAFETLEKEKKEIIRKQNEGIQIRKNREKALIEEARGKLEDYFIYDETHMHQISSA